MPNLILPPRGITLSLCQFHGRGTTVIFRQNASFKHKRSRYLRLYERAGQTIAVYSTDSLGIFCLPKVEDCRTYLKRLAAVNKDAPLLNRHFTWPGGSTIAYDVNAAKDRRVICSVDGKPVNREHGQWPLMQGDVPGFAGEPVIPTQALNIRASSREWHQ